MTLAALRLPWARAIHASDGGFSAVPCSQTRGGLQRSSVCGQNNNFASCPPCRRPAVQTSHSTLLDPAPSWSWSYRSRRRSYHRLAPSRAPEALHPQSTTGREPLSLHAAGPGLLHIEPAAQPALGARPVISQPRSKLLGSTFFVHLARG